MSLDNSARNINSLVNSFRDYDEQSRLFVLERLTSEVQDLVEESLEEFDKTGNEHFRIISRCCVASLDNLVLSVHKICDGIDDDRVADSLNEARSFLSAAQQLLKIAYNN